MTTVATGVAASAATLDGLMRRLAGVIVMLAASIATGASAQETKTVWTTPHVFPQSEYASEQQVQAAIKTFYALRLTPGATWQVEGVQATSSQVTYTYGASPLEIDEGAWHYGIPGEIYYTNYETFPEDEAAAVDRLIATATSSCYPQATIVATPKTSWDESQTLGVGDNMEPSYQEREYLLTAPGNQLCVPLSQTGAVSRFKKLQCPENAVWDDAKGMCTPLAGGLLKFTYSSQQIQNNDVCVGNPCDPTTGDKHEIALDFDLGWVSLRRHFHSLISRARSAFGAGWSHEHALRLDAGTDLTGTFTVSVTSATGYHIPFQLEDGRYVAMDQSGDVLQADGTEWVLEQVDRTLRFDADGHLISQRLDSGMTLSYGYGGGRLVSISGSNGRVLTLNYDGTGEAAHLSNIYVGSQMLVAYGYNADGMLDSVAYPDGNVVSYHYEDPNFPALLTGVTGEDGARYSTFAYDAAGRVISSTHSDGADGVALSYPAAGGAIVTDALGKIASYGLSAQSASGRPRQFAGESDATGQSQRTYYDEAVDFRRRVDTETDKKGVITKHAYAQQVIAGLSVESHTITESQGLAAERTTTLASDAASNRLVSSQRGTLLRTYTRNARHQVVAEEVKDIATATVRTTGYSYCEAADVGASSAACPVLGLLKRVDGPRVDVDDSVTYAYYVTDAASCASAGGCAYRKGDLWKISDAVGVTEYLQYDESGRPLVIREPDGSLVETTYHPRGWLASSTVRDEAGAVSRITSLTYWPVGLLKSVVEADGGETLFVYDAARRLTDVTDAAGGVLHYTLDDNGNRVEEQVHDAAGDLKSTLSRIYDELSRLKTVANASGDPTDFTYDANGNQDSATDALDRVFSSDHDPLNRLAKVVQDLGGIAATSSFEYDALDNVTKVTDPKGLATTYGYNGFGELETLTSPDTGTTTFTYDEAGNVKTRTDARGVTAAYNYDALNRLRVVQYPDPTSDVAYSYDVAPPACAAGEQYPVGRIGTMTDASGTTSYCYNPFGEVVRKVQTVNGQPLTVQYSYTRGGRLATMTYPDGTRVDYVRNGLGQISEVGVTTAGGTRSVLLGGAGYLPFGPSTGWTYGNGRALARTFDQDYRATGVADSLDQLKVGFGYDPVGDLTGLNVGGEQSLLGYDTLGRLTAFKDQATGSTIEAYTYDATGNRLSFSNSTGTDLYGYPSDSHRLTSVAGIARSYDATGSTTSIGGSAKEFVYDPRGRLSQVKLGGAVAQNYAYNGKGERVRRWQGNDATLTAYDEAGQWLGDYDAQGLARQQAIWLDDMPVGLLAGGQLYYIEPDHLGSPRLVVDPARNVPVWRWDLSGEAFGSTAPNEDPDGDGTPLVLDMRFPGQRYDATSGLSYNYFRDYESDTGRYGQSDPIGLVGGLSSYLYVEGAPFFASDLNGLQAIPFPVGPGVGGIAGAYRPVSQNDGPLPRGPDYGGPSVVEVVAGTAQASAMAINIASPNNFSATIMLIETMAKQVSMNGAQCPSAEDDREENCMALKQSVLNTCASLTGRKKFACFQAAQDTYQQCMSK